MKIKDKNSAWFKRYDLTGQRFSQLKVLSFSHFAPLYDKGGKRRSFFLCKCDCGNEIVLPGIKLKNGNNKSCGCINTPKYPIDETYFEKIDTKSKAYFLGFLYTDGTVSNSDENTKRVQLSLNTKDKIILKKFRNDLQTNKPIYDLVRKPRKYGNISVPEGRTSTLNISNVKIRNDLIKLGLTPNKTFSMKFPGHRKVSKKFMPHFIRGIFDGDGTIAKSGTSVSVNITSGAQLFLEGLSNCLFNNFNIHSSIIKYSRESKFSADKKSNYWVLNIKAANSQFPHKKFGTGYNHKSFYNLIYNDLEVGLYLARKKEKFEKIYSFSNHEKSNSLFKLKQ